MNRGVFNGEPFTPFNINIHILLSVPFTFSLLLIRQMFLNNPVLLEFSMISLVYFHCLMCDSGVIL